MKKTFLFASMLCMVGFNAISKNAVGTTASFAKIYTPSSDDRNVKTSPVLLQEVQLMLLLKWVILKA
ncbi:hypothetical protein [Pedobacter steynii]